MNNKKLIQDFSLLLRELADKYGEEYVWLALKKISDQQLWFIEMSYRLTDFSPILTVYEIVYSEASNFLFDVIGPTSNLDQMRAILCEIMQSGLIDR